MTVQQRGRKYKNSKGKKNKNKNYKDYKVNYICTYIPQPKKLMEKNYKATFNNPLTA